MITATTTKRVLWLALTIVPLFALWARASFLALAGYEGTCGLLDRSRPCSKWEYVKDYLFNAFVAPFLIAESVGWLLVVGVVAVMLFLFRKSDRVQSVCFREADVHVRLPWAGSRLKHLRSMEQ